MEYDFLGTITFKVSFSCIGRIPNPQWINEPYTRPCGVVINNNHIGDHVTLQWQYLGGTGSSPFLVFYVPLPTRGAIIPDLCYYSIRFNSGLAMSFAGRPMGFYSRTDHSHKRRCAVVSIMRHHSYRLRARSLVSAQGGTNTLTVVINPTNVVGQILFQTTNSATATVSPSTASTAT